MLFKNKLEIQILTKKKAMEIYKLFQSGKSKRQIFYEDEYSMPDIEQVESEYQNMEKVLKMKIKNNTSLTQARELINSKLLDKTTILRDVLKWDNGDINKPVTLQEFKNKYCK